MAQVFSNYAVSYLVSGITDADTSFSVAPFDGGKFQAPTVGQYELLVLTDGVSWEVVRCTARVNDAFTVERGYEGVARAWESGTLVKSTATKKTMENMLQYDNYGAAIALFNYQNFR